MMGLPVGAAAGFAVGGALGAIFGWRASMCMCGAPGLVLAYFVPRMKLPAKHASPEDTGAGAVSGYGDIICNKHFMTAVGGGVLLTCGLSIAGEWTSIYYVRNVGARLAEADLMMALKSLVGSGCGTLVFSKLTQKYTGHVHNVGFLVPAVFTLPAVALVFIESNAAQHKFLCYASGFGAAFFVYCFNGPIAAVMMQALRPELRGRAYSVWAVAQRLSEMMAPLAAGLVSDHFSLQTGMQLIWIILLVSDLWWWAGYMLPPLTTEKPMKAATTYASLLWEEQGSDAASEKSQLLGGGGAQRESNGKEYASVA